MLSRDIYFIFNVNHASNGPTSIEINNNQTYCIINSSGLGYSYYWVVSENTQTPIYPNPNIWVGSTHFKTASENTHLTKM